MKHTIYLGNVNINPASACSTEAIYRYREPLAAYGPDERAALRTLAVELRAVASSVERLAANLGANS